MRVMSFNLRSDCVFDFKNRWRERKKIVYEIINKYDCDIIGVQEVTNRMFEDMAAHIKSYDIFGAARSSRFFVERNNIMVSNRSNVVKHRTFWLSKTPDKVGSNIWYSLFPRICTTAVVELEQGEKVRVYNTHLDCFLPQARDFGLRKLTQIIEENRESEGLPVIVMGDFNATPDSKLIKKFTAGEYTSSRFVAVQDLKRDLYEKSTMSHFKGKDKGMHIDYIFVSEDLEIIDVDIIKDNIDGKYPSDHYPLIAEIRKKINK